MLANSSKYAIKALHHIVLNASEEHKLLVKDIAAATDLPQPFLSKILQQLATKNLISSSKGRRGGFYLTEAQLEGSILNVIVEIEGKDRLKMCAINFDNCDASNPCPIHHLIAAEKEELRHRYQQIKLADLKQNS
jgi:Rrf2 family protein